MDFVITRYNHLLDIPESVCMFISYISHVCRYDLP